MPAWQGLAEGVVLQRLEGERLTKERVRSLVVEDALRERVDGVELGEVGDVRLVWSHSK